MNASVDELIEVEGIGNVSAQTIRRILDTEYSNMNVGRNLER